MSQSVFSRLLTTTLNILEPHEIASLKIWDTVVTTAKKSGAEEQLANIALAAITTAAPQLGVVIGTIPAVINAGEELYSAFGAIWK